MRVEVIFPTLVGIEIIDKTLCKSATDEIKKMVSNNDVISDDAGLCISTPDNLDQRPEFAGLYRDITSKVNIYATEVLGLQENNLMCSGMWANIHNKYSKHHYHQHANSYISGVLFLDIPECKAPGEFVFVDPRNAKTMSYGDYKSGSEVANNTYCLMPKTGALLLFPSWLPHGTNPFIPDSDSKRYSLSFNYSLTSCSQPTMKIRK